MLDAPVASGTIYIAGGPRWPRELRELLRLAIPLATAQVAQMLMGVTDAVMMGRIGTTSLAAGGLGAAISMMLIVMTQGLLQSLQPIIAQARGAGNTTGFGAALSAGFLTACLAMLPIILLLCHIDTVLLWFREPAEVAQLTQYYCSALVWGIPAALWQAVFRNYISALGFTRTIMITSVFACIANLCFNWLLIFGHWGFPAFGLAGAGYATTLSWLGMTLSFGLYAALKGLLPSDLFRVPLREILRSLSVIAHLGWPIAAIYAIEMALFSGSTLIMGHFGAEAMAAHQICINVSSLTFMVPMSLGTAATIRIGFHIGARDALAGRTAGYTAIAAGACFMMFSAAILLLSEHQVIRLYLNASDPYFPAIQVLVVSLLTVAAGFQLFDGIQTVTAGALRGLKDTRPALICGIIGYWMIGMPVGAVLAFSMGFGPVGIWWGFLAGLITVSILLVGRFKYKIDEVVAETRAASFRAA